ncbi:winged helix-turn-helix domain-containing protein [Methanobacterium alkalithermotolerans]|uniref:Winged helix-turn-helix domain-containing protein n=1 Tax=Methanobacterium alkalithermotolerans TaxID=2731220 RepID=A0A8T8K8D7_9EURY|nr:winged helix-turn-helix domain-containing protein [Methanobacterium alkalithermotolerans]QUH23835.1 winged helix-turn-helix domain-containing protein [Methanobacterium alkalithermotolerans]
MTDLENLFNYYDFVQDDLKFMIKSRIRLNILSSITEYPKAMKEIKEENDLSFAAISNNMKRLLEENMVIKIEDKYLISQIGLLKLYSLMDFLKLMSSTKKFEELWLNHDMGGVPDFLLEDLGALKDSELIKANYKDVFKPYTEYSKLLENAKEIKGVSPFFNPSDVDLFDQLSEKGIKIELILTAEVLEQIVKTSKLRDIFKDLKRVMDKNLSMWVYNDKISVAFTVSDNFLSLGLMNDDGSYDQNRDLVSSSNDAVNWGENLFNYYLSKSEKLSTRKIANYLLK